VEWLCLGLKDPTQNQQLRLPRSFIVMSEQSSARCTHLSGMETISDYAHVFPLPEGVHNPLLQTMVEHAGSCCPDQSRCRAGRGRCGIPAPQGAGVGRSRVGHDEFRGGETASKKGAEEGRPAEAGHTFKSNSAWIKRTKEHLQRQQSNSGVRPSSSVTDRQN